MIRPVPYVDLPGIVYALDRRVRARNGEFANFVIAPELEEPRSSIAALLSALWPFTPNANTWICEDRWHLLGVAQGQPRPGSEAWDLVYLGAMTAPGGQPATIAAQNDVLMELAQYSLNAALMRGVHRFFARVEDDRHEVEIFGKLGFQRYARELTYWLPSAQHGLEQLERAAHAQPVERVSLLSGATVGTTATPPDAVPRAPEAWRRPDGQPTGNAGRDESERGGNSHLGGVSTGAPDLSLRPWHHHDAWGLLRLYDACTPRRVQVAESLTNDEFIHTRAGGGRTWRFPLIEPASLAFVNDRGVRLGGWIRLRYGRGSQPHQLWSMAHPDEPGMALALVRFGLQMLAREAPRDVISQVREYEGPGIDALRRAGFEHCATHALLVRHLAMRALRNREVPALEPRVVYGGVKGLGTAHTPYSKGEKTHYATSDH
ncbi:MAG: hypothetical protein ACXWQR_04560 [Ktedonobacterales bacterium]